MANGFALGGFGQGLTSGFSASSQVFQRNRALGQKDRALGLQEQEFEAQQAQAEQEQQQELQQQQLDIANKALDGWRNVITEATNNGGPEAGARLVKQFQGPIVMAAENVHGILTAQKVLSGQFNPQEILTSMTALTQIQPTAADAGTREGNINAAALDAELQRTATPPERARGADVAPGNANSQNFIGPNGEKFLLDLNSIDAGEQIKRLNAAGFVEFGLNVQPTSPEGVASIFGKKSTEESAVDALELGVELIELRSLMAKLRDIGPGAVGARGLIAESIGGPIGQFNEALGEGFTRVVAGATQSALIDLKTDMRLTAISFIPETTAEESERITDSERKLNETATRLLKVGANFAQIISAVGALTKAKIVNRETKLFLAGQPSDYDTSTGDGQDKMLISFLEAGMSMQQAGELGTIITRMQALMKTNPQGLGISSEFLPQQGAR